MKGQSTSRRTLPTAIFLLVGGAITDRRERRRVLLSANLVEAVAIVPTLIPAEQFTAASALDQSVRPLSAQLLGPALGGVLLVPRVRDPEQSVRAGPSR